METPVEVVMKWGLEVERLVHEIQNKRGQLINYIREKQQARFQQLGFYTEEKCSLLDVFHFVHREEFPCLWGEVEKMLAVMPTTACCEQSFSVVKHSLHTNMAGPTALAKAVLKIHSSTETFFL